MYLVVLYPWVRLVKGRIWVLTGPLLRANNIENLVEYPVLAIGYICYTYLSLLRYFGRLASYLPKVYKVQGIVAMENKILLNASH